MSMQTIPNDRNLWHLTWKEIMRFIDTINPGDKIILTEKEYYANGKACGCEVVRSKIEWTVEKKYGHFMTVSKWVCGRTVRTSVNYVGYFLERSEYCV